MRFFVKLLYGFSVRGLDRVVGRGRVLIAAHFVSHLDPAFYALFVPGAAIAMPACAARKWYVRLLCRGVPQVVVDHNDAASLKTFREFTAAHETVVYFPEGVPTGTGVVGKVGDVAVAMAQHSGAAAVIPACAGGAQYGVTSRMKGRMPQRMFPRITLRFGEPVAPRGEGDKRYSMRRAIERGLDLVLFESLWERRTIFDSCLGMREIWGGSHIVACDPNGDEIDWNGLILKVTIFANRIARETAPDERVGIMLPNTIIALVVILAVQRAGRTPAMINFSMGPRGTISACKTAGIRKILTASRFVEEAKLTPLVEALSGEGVETVILERMAASFTTGDKLSALVSSFLAAPRDDSPEDAARTGMILFTSGSEGAPKAVALSYDNIQANTAQVRTALDFCGLDTLLDNMPIFHSFGLCTGTFMPLNTGMKIAFYPTPLHYKKIPQYAYDIGATVLFASNAFLAGYAKNAEEYDFAAIRYVLCGGDKMKESTYRAWIEKFGIRILEGYGVTESSPVVGVNRVGHYSRGSIGRPVAGIECRITPVEGVAEGGRLVIKGPNIMKGYMRDGGSVIVPPEDGWYDTGDIVTIDDDFITIKGRAKRFAKIGGEMISLAALEEVVSEIWPDTPSAAVGIPDEVRGEVIVLLTERQDPDREELMRGLSARGVPELAMPKRILPVESLPRIGVGKTDYQTAAKYAEERA